MYGMRYNKKTVLAVGKELIHDNQNKKKSVFFSSSWLPNELRVVHEKKKKRSLHHEEKKKRRRGNYKSKQKKKNSNGVCSAAEMSMQGHERSSPIFKDYHKESS
jgi:hypothetical protein